MSRTISFCLVMLTLTLATPALATMRYLNQVMEWSCKYCHTTVQGIRSQDSSLSSAERFKLNAIGLALLNDPAAYELLKSRGASHAIRWYNKPWLTKPR
ncbi:MAG: hypothetical protein A3F16_04150 [Deltaproteobacteria bacterium RIFCSPHIGHO2_12_FULL_43_9]|nr:MAG: hypothetical protein A3F16_04150 [Deltaproteobacteria bacterium RIFCSPHIGHO2_12_FULL_43_9]